MSDRLGTAQWEEQAAVAQRHPFAQGKFWLGRAEDATAIGYRDDRHICLVSGTRGGKGTSVIVNNLCFWPGSAVVVDPKGENATVTAARRGQGAEHCAGMGQAVHVLDPFKTAQVDERYLSCFNPLDALDPQRDETIDEASRLANAIVVVKDDSHDPFWDESARTMLRGLILHVLTAKGFTDDERNLITVRNLITRGEWRIAEAIRELGHEEDKIDPPHLLLCRSMELNPAFDGVVAGTGSRFRTMMVSSPKTFEGVFQAVANHTEFIDSPGMRRVLAKSDFRLSELKTRPEGMTLYLSLPQRYMETHYRWLRMMVALTTTEMEMTRGQPASGYPVLMVLDEFAGLRRMAAIENAVAQIAGFGVKLFFVVQSLEQLKNTYKDNWETFLSNAGLKVFFSVEDHFSREYVSKLIGETEIIRELRSANESQSQNEGYSEGRSASQTLSQSTTAGTSDSQTTGSNESTSSSRGTSGGVSYQYSRFLWFRPKPNNFHFSEGQNSSTSQSRGTSRSDTRGSSYSDTGGTSDTTGTSETYTRGSSTTAGTGRSESLHRRPLIQPDEVGREFARIDDKNDPRYPGLALVIVTGANPFAVKRRNYFEDRQFTRCFSPHPDHKFLPIPSTAFDVAKIRKLLDDFWNDEVTLDQTRLLLRAELDGLEKSHAAFCDPISDFVSELTRSLSMGEPITLKQSMKWGCEAIRNRLVDIFCLALAKKSGNEGWQGTTLTYLHELIDYNVACSEMEDMIASPETRPAFIHTPANLTKEDHEKLRELIPGLKRGFPNIRHGIPDKIAPFFPFPTRTEPPPTFTTQRVLTPRSNSATPGQWVLTFIFVVLCAAFLWYFFTHVAS